MTEIAVSVIVVSRHRPQALLRCLTGLRQLYYHPFEVIVVADPQGLKTLQEAGSLQAVKHAEFDEPNISVARNIGLGLAAGEVVAFIDDDAVPEPMWLTHLIAAFRDDTVSAAGGYVRARNGISFQSKARRVDHLGAHEDILWTDSAAIVLTGSPGKGIKTEGTNCAFRRHMLLSMGGFDPAFHFYLDETDLNLRLAALGAKTAIVPLAEVHHGFDGSAQRRPSRMPRTLFDVGASFAVFLRKHAAMSETSAAMQAMRVEQKARLVRHMIAGTCEPADVVRVMKTLEHGFDAGATRRFGDTVPLVPRDLPFLSFQTLDRSAPSLSYAGRVFSRGRLRRKALQEVKSGKRVSLYCFSPTSLYHSVSFTHDGYWLQSGGLFGRSERGDPMVKVYRFSQRLRREKNRVEAVRNITSG